MEKIPTLADYVLENYDLTTKVRIKSKKGYYKSLCSYDLAIKFAKLHVKAALKEASEKATMIKIDEADMGDITVHIKDVDRKAILNIYPITNIK